MTDNSHAPATPPAAAGDAPMSALRVRPYTVTGGRTRTEVDLEIETMIRATPNTAADQGLVSEARALVDLCATPPSIAEISARLRLPLQVIKILAGDLVMAGRVQTYTGSGNSDGRPDLALLERVLDGLQAL